MTRRYFSKVKNNEKRHYWKEMRQKTKYLSSRIASWSRALDRK